MLKKIWPKFRQHLWRNLIFALIGLVLIFTVPQKIKAVVDGPAALYETTQPEKKDLTQIVDASGVVAAHEEAVIQFQSSGKLQWVGVQKGQAVKKWQAIASLDRESLQQNLKKELLDYESERWDFEQDHDDYNSNGLPIEKTVTDDAVKRILEKAQFDLDDAVIDYELAKLSYDLAVIYTPIEGIITEIDSPLPGVNITPATARFTVTNPNSMYFDVKIDEADIGLIKEGQTVEIVLDAYPDETYEGTIEKIHFASVTTRGGGTAFPVEISLPENTDLRFRSGMNGDAEIVTAKTEAALSLPYRAVKGSSKPYVEVIENRKVIQKDVQTGLETETYIEILSGLSEKDVVIVSEKKKD